MGNNKNSIIEINGKRYYADSGQLVGGNVSETTAIAPTPISKADPTDPTYDVAPATSKPHHTGSQPTHHTRRHTAKDAKRHNVQHSKTLNRQAVKKPSANLKRRVKAQGNTDSLAAKPSSRIEPKLSVRHIDAKKADHANNVAKSRLVKKFNRSQPSSVAIPVAVKRLPQPTRRKVHRTAPPKPDNPTDEMLRRAIHLATSHEERAPKHIAKRRRGPSRRATSLIAISVALVVLGGFVAITSAANVRLKVASARAGFSASLPAQAPAGYHLGHLNSSPGTVAINYHSNSDDRSFAITEKASDWDSGTLRDSYLATSGQDYQTVETGGRTLFLLGQNAATWVSGGVWYQVRTNGALSSQQMVALATSL